MAKNFNPNSIRQSVQQLKQNANRSIQKLRQAERDLKNLERKFNHEKAKSLAAFRKLQNTSRPVQYTDAEWQLANRVYQTVAEAPPREYDVFLSYAQDDGTEVAEHLCRHLQEYGTSVWMDSQDLTPGMSQARQMDKALTVARCGISLVTPLYLSGRFWIERELGPLLGKSVLIPVLHNVTFEELSNYSAMLADMVGFTTDSDTIEDIAAKIAPVVMVAEV